jgi:hypothetical protein
MQSWWRFSMLSCCRSGCYREKLSMCRSCADIQYHGGRSRRRQHALLIGSIIQIIYVYICIYNTSAIYYRVYSMNML